MPTDLIHYLFQSTRDIGLTRGVEENSRERVVSLIVVMACPTLVTCQHGMEQVPSPFNHISRLGALLARKNLYLECIVLSCRRPEGSMPASTLQRSFGTRPFQAAAVPPLGVVRIKYRSIIRCSRSFETETISRRANMQVGGRS